MRIDQNKCVACLECMDYCPVEAIEEDESTGQVVIDEEECVECGCCLRADVCASEAIWQPEMAWPRTIRREFSDPRWSHPSTGVRGRGTSEMKTNDVTGRYGPGEVGIAVEMGRPGIGARLREVERVTMAIASMDIELEKQNPVYSLIADPVTGRLKEEVLNEKVLSAIVELKTTPTRVPAVLNAIKTISGQVETVFSVDMCSLLAPDGTCEAERIALEAGFELRPNGKNNIGLGRPVADIRGRQ